MGQLAARLGLDLPAGADPAVQITGVTHDSRQVRPADLYAALPGARVHGADFAGAAIGAGAVAVLTDQAGSRRCADAAAAAGVPVLTVADPRARLGVLAAWIYGEPGTQLTLVGITGTNGKTTTAYLTEAGFAAAGRRAGLIGTIEARVGSERIASARTTPEAPDLQALLAVMRERGADGAVMEVSSHALALGRVDGTVYDVAVFTNLGEDHLDFHADVEDYFAAKASLFSPERARCAVINVDDPYGARLAALAAERGLPVISVSPSGSERVDWAARDVQLDPRGAAFTLHGPGGASAAAAVGMPGAFNVENAALALVALAAAGVPLPAAVRGVAACPGVPGRMERVQAGQPFLAVVDYAHTPQALAAALQALRAAVPGRLIVVLGCGGDRDRDKRPVMGKVAASGADVVLVTDDNPRSEDPAAIRAAVISGARSARPGEGAQVLDVAERAATIAAAVERAGPGDAVLVAGKGHEQGQEVAGVVLPFDDRQQLAEAIRARA